MILGKQDILEAVKRLVPVLLKICSYEMENDDPNRGQTYFHQHQMYLKATSEQEKQQIDQLGSTYLILCLESILHWAKWIPLDNNNKVSIYSKAYNDLVQRGVTFPTNFYYYKQSDTQKFKNTYKVEFFTDSYYTTSMAQGSNQSKYNQSQLQNQSQLSKKQQKNNINNNNNNNSNNIRNSTNNNLQQMQFQLFQQTTLQTIGQMRQFIQQLSSTVSSSTTPLINKRLSLVNNRLQQLYPSQFAQSKLLKNKNLKILKNWTDEYFYYYKKYQNKQIQYKQFVKKVNSQKIEISGEYVDGNGITNNDNYGNTNGNNYGNTSNNNYGYTNGNSLNIHNNNNSIKNNQITDTKMLKSTKQQFNYNNPSSLYEDTLKKQQFQYKNKLLQLKTQLQDKNNQIMILKQTHKKQKHQLVSDYQRRMLYLKSNVSKQLQNNNKPLTLQLQYQNQHLKKKVNLLEKQLQSLSKQDNLIIGFKNQIQKVKLENQKLLKVVNEKKQIQQKLILMKLENQSNKEKYRKNQEIRINDQNQKKNNHNNQQLENLIIEKNQRIIKLQKNIRKTEDQLELYKSQLIAQRNKKDHKNTNLQKRIQYLEDQNKNIKGKLHETKRTLDIKDVQLIDLKQNMKRYQIKLKTIGEKNSNFSQTHSNKTDNKLNNYLSPQKIATQVKASKTSLIPSNNSNQLSSRSPSSTQIKYINYSDLFFQLKPSNKQLFLRLCRSSLKKKDIIFKQHQLQIGVISQALSDNKVMFMLHLTNLTDKQIENIRIEPIVQEGSFISTLSYQMNLNYVFCIQPQEQEKVKCVVENKQSPYIKDRAVVTVSYYKNSTLYTHNILLPFVITKFLDNSKPSKVPNNPKYIKEQLAFNYTKKMLPKPGYLKNYFQNIDQKILQKKYDVQLYHKQTDLLMYVAFNFGQCQTLLIEVIIMRQKLNQRQKYIMQEVLGFLEIAFRK